MNINGFQLDEHNMLVHLFNEDNSDAGWWIFTFIDEIVNGNVVIEYKWEDDKAFKMKQIDLNNFEWNGKSVRAEITSNN